MLIIEAASGRVLHELEGPSEGVEWLAWHPVGDFVVAGSEDFTAWMWNAPLGKCMTVRLVLIQQGSGFSTRTCLPG